MNFVAEPYQDEATLHLVERNRAALFTGMGLGKTVVSLTALTDVASSSSLVVAPVRVCNLTWPNEVARWRHLRPRPVANLRTRSGWEALRAGIPAIYTTNYEALPRLVAKYLKGQRAKDWPWDTVIFDELTMAKNPKSKRINAIRPYLERRPDVRRWGLTGTPTPNSLMELFAQIRLLDDGQRLGRSFSRFRDTYFHATDYMRYNWVENPGAREAIFAKISDLVLAQRTEDYLDVMPPEVEDISVPLPEEARAAYDELEKELLLQYDEQTIVAQTAAVLVNKLQQMTGGNVYRTADELDPVGGVVHIHRAKLDALLQLMKRHKNEPVLIASCYRAEQARILAEVKGAERFPTEARRQQEALARWDRGQVRAFVTDPRSMGHGLNLQAGGRLIVWYSVPWSGEVYPQFNARLIRRGQTEQVKIYRLVSADTVDEAVIEAHDNKSAGQTDLMRVLRNLRLLQQTHHDLL